MHSVYIFYILQKKKKCYWPPNHPNQKAKKNQLPDKDNWSIYNVRVFGYSGEIVPNIQLVIYFGKLINNAFQMIIVML